MSSDDDIAVIDKIYNYMISFIATYVRGQPVNEDVSEMQETICNLISDSREMEVDGEEGGDGGGADGSIYIISKVDDDMHLKLLILYSIFYYLDSLRNVKYYIGIDFEFNQHKIALCQLCFFTPEKTKYIFVYDPNMLSTQQQNVIIKMVYASPIYKIMHGSDSLDVPYIYEELFQNDSDKIIAFTQYLFDTRFMCEYEKILKKHKDNKCSLYDAMLYFGVISKKKYDKFNKNYELMGPIYKYKWNIHNINDIYLLYASYDVIYLRSLCINITHKLGKKKCLLINEITRLIYYEKHGLCDNYVVSKVITDKMNNYEINGRKLASFYDESIFKYNGILKINYFKGSMTTLYKRILYTVLSKKGVIQISKKKIMDEKLNLDDMFNELKNLKLGKVISLIGIIYTDLKDKIHI